MCITGVDMEPQIPDRVSIVDIRMPFWSMVVFLVKLSIASIPAFLILSALGAAVFALLGWLGAITRTWV
ncbi:MAG: hypothetical protein LT103_09305 [Burkholderiaceae bacterium]|nr:hypothetical protein [Burkholderiaceae bacterium]